MDRPNCTASTPPRGSAPIQRPPIAWIDGIGGVAIAAADRMTIGRNANLPIRGNLRSVAGELIRRGEDWFWRGHVDDATDQNAAEILLGEGDPIPIGGGVDLTIHRPGALTATRRLDLRSPHRWAGGVDSVLLVATVATIGPTPSDSIRACNLDQTHYLCTAGSMITLRCDAESATTAFDPPAGGGDPIRAGELTLAMRPWDV